MRFNASTIDFSLIAGKVTQIGLCKLTAATVSGA
jgi:hypothetical protein